MVFPEHNSGVNARLRFDNNSEEQKNVYQPGRELTRYLRGINENMEAIQHNLQKGQIDIDQYESEPSLGTITLTNPTRQPWLLTDLIATWNPATTTTPTASAFPNIVTSGVAVQNPYSYPVQVVLAGFTATQTFVNGILVGAGNGTYIVPGYGSLSVTFTVAGSTTPTGIAQASTVTSVTLTIKDKVFQLNAASGEFQALGMHGIQMDKDATVKLTASSPIPCFLEMLGTSDYRKVERSVND